MATKVNKAQPAKGKKKVGKVHEDSSPTLPAEHYEEHERSCREYREDDGRVAQCARTNRPSHYTRNLWLIKIVPAGSMVAVAVYYTGVLLEETTMDIKDGREYAGHLLETGYKKVPRLF